MKKIPTLFVRDFYSKYKLVIPVIQPGNEWVFLFNVTPTEKLDGSCCLIKDNKLYRRFDAKHGKTPPLNFIPAQDPDPITNHWPGWVEVTPDNPADKYHITAFNNTSNKPDGTYELLGPKINNNPHNYPEHILIKHGQHNLRTDTSFPTILSFSSIKEYLQHTIIEGIVFYSSDNKMSKIKRKDFGFKWPVKK